MLSHIEQHRNWIVPYPVDGLKALLKEGIVKGSDAYEKNWCALRLAVILTYERTDGDQINRLIANLKRDKDGRILLRKGDEALREMIEGRVQKLSVQE